MSSVVAAPVSTKVSGTINLDSYTDLLECSTVHERIDLGVALVIKALHPVFGLIVLVNTIGENSAVLYM